MPTITERTWRIQIFCDASLNGNYRIEYKSFDSIGYYTGVTSFTLGPDDEILYNTQSVNVYDSLHHQADSRTRDRYTYLQVPLLLGYRILETGRISLAVQAGPALSILLGSREADPVIRYSNATVIRVDDQTPDRTRTSWQRRSTVHPGRPCW